MVDREHAAVELLDDCCGHLHNGGFGHGAVRFGRDRTGRGWCRAAREHVKPRPTHRITASRRGGPIRRIPARDGGVGVGVGGSGSGSGSRVGAQEYASVPT
ncbi:hypothetical protein BMA10399_G0624 [Burkholderia mallei ATCC 10399]|nr:hypothetical protein BMAFMH_I0139 [Burkholderia mallei FMH]EDP85441.1 hypothetical protein BMA10399_G0624 [Burkholderia mallei ATCC 10399]